MSPNGLEETIRVEQEVLALIAAEQRKAASWVQEQKAALEKTIAIEQHDLCAREEQNEERIRTDFAEKATTHLRQAEERALFLTTIDAHILKDLVRKLLLETLPGV